MADTQQSDWLSFLTRHKLQQYHDALNVCGIANLENLRSKNEQEIREIANAAGIMFNDKQKWINVCKQWQLKRFKSIDISLNKYYESFDRKDYKKTETGIGKFLFHCDIYNLHPSSLDLQLSEQHYFQTQECHYLGWDDNFPYYIPLPRWELKEQMFRVLSYCHKYGTPPKNEYKPRSEWKIGSKLILTLGRFPSQVSKHEAVVKDIRNNKGLEELILVYSASFEWKGSRWSPKLAPMDEYAIDTGDKGKESLDLFVVQTFVEHYGRDYGIEIPMDVIELMTLWYDESTICLMVTIFGKNGRRTIRVPTNPNTRFMKLKGSIASMEGMEAEINDYKLEVPRLQKEVKGHLSPKDYSFNTNQMLFLRRRNQFKS